MGNFVSWRVHMQGAKRMVAAHGGLSEFGHNPNLLDKLLRQALSDPFPPIVWRG